MKLKLNSIKWMLLSCLVLMLFSCEEHVIDTEEETGIVETCNPNTSFSGQVEPIIQNNCVSCHNGSQPPNLTSYSRISNNSDIIKSVVITRRMPLGGSLSNEEIDAIKCWVDNGTQDN